MEERTSNTAAAKDDLVDVLNSMKVSIAVIAELLDRRDLISKPELADAFRQASQGVKKIPVNPPDRPRLDIDILSSFADMLERRPPPWSPVVIDGGGEGS